jgi:hypothetical protein
MKLVVDPAAKEEIRAAALFYDEYRGGWDGNSLMQLRVCFQK